MDRRNELKRAFEVLQNVGVMPKTVFDRVHYIVTDTKGMSGKVDLIDSNTKLLRGVCSFDGNKMNKGKYIVLDGIRILVDRETHNGKTATWEGEMLPELLNAEFRIFQDEDLVKLPISVLASKLNNEKENDGFYSLATAPIIMPEKDFKIEILFPEIAGSAIANDAKQYIRIELQGFEFSA